MSTTIRTGYKQTKVGVIPEDWDAIIFDELFSFRNGVNTDKVNYGKGTPFINVLEPITYSHIHGHEITGKVTLSESVTASYSVRRGDVLFNRTSEVLEEIGLASVYLGTDRVIFGGFVIRGRPNGTKLDPLYSGYSLRAPFIRAQLIPMGQGAIRANIGQQNLGRVVTILPPLPEQCAIAAALSDIDALLGKLDALIAKKRDLKQAAMQQLLTGKTRLPGFSGEWVQRSIASFSAFVTKGATPTTYGFKWVSDGVIFLRSECVAADGLDLTQSMYISEAAHKVLIRGEVRPGDILITITGNVGRIVTVNEKIDVGNINQHIARIRVIDTDVSSEFVSHWLSQPVVRHYYSTITTGQAYPQLSLKQVRETLVPLGAIDEQTAIATILADMDAELAALEARRDKTRALKQGMMQELLTGRIRLV